MRYRLLLACIALSCVTTFLSLQQTQQHSLKNKIIPCLHNQNNTNFKILKNHRYEVNSNKDLMEKYYQKTFASERFKAVSLKRNRSLANFNHFLLPVLYYNMGPNNLFRIFRETIVIANLMERTLVVPPFHHHPRMKRNEEEKLNVQQNVEVDIFDQTYQSVMESDATKSLDLRTLNLLLPTVTIEKFHLHCQGHLDVLVVCGDVKLKRKTGLHQFQKMINISIAESYSVNNFRNLFDKKKENIHFLSAIHKTKNRKCIGLAMGSKCLGSRKTWFENWKNFSEFVRRPPKIKILAEQFIMNNFMSQSFLAIHWRYDPDDWGDMCKSSRPASVREINQPVCEFTRQLQSNASSIASFATSLHNYAAERDLRYIYIATPPQLIPFVKSLQLKLPNLFSTSDVLKFSQWKALMVDVFTNNYSASFLDQEICYLAKEFLGSPISSWTQTVMLDRFAEGRDNHGSILDVVMKGRTGFPKLEWYFPEGD